MGQGGARSGKPGCDPAAVSHEMQKRDRADDEQRERVDGVPVDEPRREAGEEQAADGRGGWELSQKEAPEEEQGRSAARRGDRDAGNEIGHVEHVERGHQAGVGRQPRRVATPASRRVTPVDLVSVAGDRDVVP